MQSYYTISCRHRISFSMYAARHTDSNYLSKKCWRAGKKFFWSTAIEAFSCHTSSREGRVDRVYVYYTQNTILWNFSCLFLKLFAISLQQRNIRSCIVKTTWSSLGMSQSLVPHFQSQEHIDPGPDLAGRRPGDQLKLGLNDPKCAKTKS